MFLYGVNCTNEVWEPLRGCFSSYDTDFAYYPHDATIRAKSPDDLADWVFSAYGSKSYDAVIGHSLGGIIAMQLAAEHSMNFGEIIFLDTK